MNAMRETIAVAIDFGTTYSGIAYTRVNSNIRMLPVQLGDWPGQPPSRNSYKVPTIVAYPDNGGPPLWGFEAERSSQIRSVSYLRMRVFKPFLDPACADQCRTPPGIGLADVVRDYIQGLYAHLIQALATEGFSSNETDFDFLLTVPATYGNGAVENFRRIIKTTGIGNHNFSVSLTEPEAASLYTIQAQPMQTSSLYRENDCFVVCDAGGGTVDLSSYTITQLNPAVRVEQTGVTSGAYCGSTSIDMEFRSYVEALMGPEVWQSLTIREKEIMAEGFVEQKERFDNSPYDDSFNIRLARDNIPCPGKKGGYLPISREQMQRFFAEPVRKTQELIGSHIQECIARSRQVSFLFLVGGFGTSPYLKQQIEEYVRGIDPRIRVVKPSEAQQAVVLGAILNQMQLLKKEEDPVQSRLCRAHYGLVTMQPFNPMRHYDYEKFVHPVTGEAFAKDQVAWFINKGQRVTDGPAACIEKQLMRKFEVCDHVWQEILVSCTGDNPPIRLGPEVTPICKLTSDLRGCPKREFEKKKKRKEGCLPFRSTKYYQATYTVKMYIGTADLRFEMIYKDRLRSDLLTLSWDSLDHEAER